MHHFFMIMEVIEYGSLDAPLFLKWVRGNLRSAHENPLRNSSGNYSCLGKMLLIFWIC